MVHSAFWPAHELSPDLPLPGHGGNFTLSGSDCSTLQHRERYTPGTWLIAPALGMTAFPDRREPYMINNWITLQALG
jgi:hypothetical protein